MWKGRSDMDYFAGLDISMDETHICVLDREGVVVHESKTASTAQAIAYELAKAPRALSRELNLAARNLEVPVRAQAAVAARHDWNASSRRMWSVWREVRWRWTLKVLKMAA